MNWTPKRLDQLGTVSRGRSRHRPRNDDSLYGGAYPFVQTGDVKEAEFHISKFGQTYNEKGLAQSKLWHPGTLCITIAANIADTAILKIPACFPDSIVGFVADPHQSDVRFVKYSIDFMKTQMQNASLGTTQDNLSVDKLLTFEMPVPLLSIQRKIAAILFAYDAMVEINSRRIRILEELAQVLYCEWFVYYRFPGHEQCRTVNSEIGLIPEGWAVTSIGNVADVLRGRSYTGAEVTGTGGVLFLNLKCIARDGGFRHDGIKRYIGSFKPMQTAKEGDIIMAVTDVTQERRLVARAARVPRLNEEISVFSMDLVKVVPRAEISGDYLFGTFRFTSFPDEIKQHANGANVLHLNPERISSFVFPLAPRTLRDLFASYTHSMFAECDVLQQKNECLRQTRDLLLPKLISGEVDVADLDIETGEPI